MDTLTELPPASAETLSRYDVMTRQGPVGVELRQTSTRAERPEDFALSGEQFSKRDIDWGAAKQHVAIHEGGQIAGSQFSAEAFADADEIVGFLDALLPDSLPYDQAERAELTLDVQLPDGRPLGYSGVKPLAELTGRPDVVLTRGMRQPGGQSATVDGVKGAWYPELTRDQATGGYVVAANPDGSPRNPRGKFEPEVFIAKAEDAAAMATDKVTVIIQKSPDGRPRVLTMFPGENAPALPALINSEQFQANTLQGPVADFWQEHAFIQAA